LRLAFVLWNGKIGGAETFAVALTRALRGLGVDARVVFVESGEPLAREFLEAGIPFEELRLKRGRATLSHPRRFARAVAAAGPDGAVLCAGGFLALALRLGGYRGRMAAVEHGTVLQLHTMPAGARLLRHVDRLSGARAVDVHVAVSDFLRERVKAGSRPVVTIPNGVDLDVYRPLTASKAGDRFVVGCMSRLIPGKGVEDVITATQQLMPRGVRLRIAGDGSERSRLERMAKQLGVEERVEFLGWVQGPREVAAFWNECDVAVSAPSDWVESFGLAAVEAMACGRPVVATCGGALPETVVHGRTGFLVEPRDVQALAAALLSYLDDPALSATHGAAARERCEDRFDVQRCAQAYAALFRRASGARRGELRVTTESRLRGG
jgi:glycosyltransferase involved in cell wall biosynthesis